MGSRTHAVRSKPSDTSVSAAHTRSDNHRSVTPPPRSVRAALVAVTTVTGRPTGETTRRGGDVRVRHTCGTIIMRW
ncbi:hypothetical protein GCM10023220_64390 [Streptomyces ziwulingensis]|uniref:Uncharacterized protein n=1 Tax=Streptomyces ziwulingensis TaxID=1045501 RepID=A0ABP9D176_9ACTN